MFSEIFYIFKKIPVILMISLFSVIQGAYLYNIPIKLSQPNGIQFSCYATGDEFYVRLHNENNYTIIQNQVDGYYYYAELTNNNISPTTYRADEPIPDNSIIMQGIQISSKDYWEKRNNYNNQNRGRDAPTIGTINNINIFIRFADENEFGTPRYIMDEPFNKSDGPSLAHYFDEVSYSQLEVNTYHYPICEMETNLSYQDQYPRSYYQPYNAQTNPNGYTDANATIREHTLLKNAVEFITQEVPIDLDVDGNDDGYVDNVTFLVSGSPDGWSDLLWPHRWSLFSFDVWINGSIVDAYNLNLATGGYFTVGTLCHEFFHSLGAPDLYHYTDTGAPTSAGGWDIMDGSSDTPQYMSAWMKHKYGNWIECPIIEQLGIYPLLPLQYQENSCFRINSPNSTNEFFILEYRKKEGIYEINTPGNDSGILIYRINGNLNGNANGPPDEVYLYRPGGTTTDNGNLTSAIFSEETGRTEINDSTDPSSFLYGGAPGGLNIQDIGNAGDIIEFTYWNIFVQTAIESLINDDDNDGILNPGESAELTISANILSAPSDAFNVIGNLSSELDWVHFSPEEIIFGTIPNNGNSINIQTTISINDTEYLLPAEFNLHLNAEFQDNGTTINYADMFEYEIDITLNQMGFPISTNEIRSSPLVIDINNDGMNEIILGDYSGIIHIFNSDGSELINNTFPFDTGSSIWGSAAAADLDLDGYLDFIIPSKNKHLYIFDHNGIKLDYETDLYLIGTPAIGNLNDNENLEVVFSGYSPNNKVFAIDIDGNNINGFPIHINEKTKAGSALADFNNNGKDDIVVGTDDNYVHLFYDNGIEADGFPFLTNDKIQAPPSILDINGEKIIFVSCNDNIFYAINADGNLRFSITTSDNVNTSPAFIKINETIYIAFGSRDNHIYIVDTDGNSLTNWPITLNDNIEGGIISADVDNDGIPEIIATTENGNVYVFHIDGALYHHFPINNDLPFTGAPIIIDIDNDNDLEILNGGINTLSVFDIKEYGNATNYWNMFKGNQRRNSYFPYSTSYECNVDLGDVNGDTTINILDIVQIANYILEFSIPNYICAGDFNLDDSINILDLVQIANYILN